MTRITPEYMDYSPYEPIATNVTLEGLKNCGLKVGDIIRSNGFMHGKILEFDYDRHMISVETIKGTIMDLSANNQIDLIH